MRIRLLAKFGLFVILTTLVLIVGWSPPARVAAQNNTTPASNITDVGAPALSQPATNNKTLTGVLRGQGQDGGTVLTMWNVMLRLADTFVILFFLVIAFATIMHIQYDTYGVKKAIFPLMVGIVLAHFSLVIVQNFTDFSQVLASGFFNNASVTVAGQNCEHFFSTSDTAAGFACNITNALFNNGAATFKNVQGEATGGLFVFNLATMILGGTVGALAGGLFLLMFGVAVLLVLIPTLLIIALSFMLFIRAYLIMFLAIIAPLAWLAIWWSPIQGMFKKWWSQFTMWVFMAPVVVFFLWMAIEFFRASGYHASFGSYLLTMLMLYLALTMPFKMGGAVMSVWAGWGKKAAAMGLGVANGWGSNMLDRFGAMEIRGKTISQRTGIQSLRSTWTGLKQNLETKQAYAKTLAEERGGEPAWEGWGTSFFKGAMTVPRYQDWRRFSNVIPRFRGTKGQQLRVGQSESRDTEARNRRIMEGAYKVKDQVPNVSNLVAGAKHSNKDKALEYVVGAQLNKTLSKEDRAEVEKAFYMTHYKKNKPDVDGDNEDQFNQYVGDSNVQSMVDQARKTTDPFSVKDASERKRVAESMTARQKAELTDSYRNPIMRGSNKEIDDIIRYLERIDNDLKKEKDSSTKTYNVGGQQLNLAQYRKLITGELARFTEVAKTPEAPTIKPIISEDHAKDIKDIKLDGKFHIGGSVDLLRVIDQPTQQEINIHGTPLARDFLNEIKKPMYSYLSGVASFERLKEINPPSTSPPPPTP